MSSKMNLGMFQSTPEGFDGTDNSQCPMTAMGVEFDPFSEEFIDNPFPFFQRARKEEPIFFDHDMGYWVISKFDDIISVFRDPETFSATIARHPVTPLCPAAAEVRNNQEIAASASLVDEAPEIHRAHRKIFGDAFTPKRVTEVDPQIRKIVCDHIDRFVDDGEADLVSQLLYEVPALAIFIFLGAPDNDALLVKELGATRSIVNWGKPTDEEQVAMMSDIGKHWSFTTKLVDAALKEPGDNYLGDMVRIYHEDPSRFTINYLYNVMFLMQFAGHETTTQASANGIRALLENRDQWLAMVDNPELIPGAVEEILRYDSSIFTWRRITTKATEIAGVKIPEGAKIIIATGSGSRDDDVFHNGDELNIYRENAKRNLAFGHGAHFCMGAPLARLEMKIILEELARRIPNMELVEDQKWEYIPSLCFRGIQHLKVKWEPS